MDTFIGSHQPLFDYVFFVSGGDNAADGWICSHIHNSKMRCEDLQRIMVVLHDASPARYLMTSIKIDEEMRFGNYAIS